MQFQDIIDFIDDRIDDAIGDQGYAFTDQALQDADDDFNFWADLLDQLLA